MSSWTPFSRWHYHAPERHRRAGVTVIGVGVGLMFMLGMLAERRVGVGVGGFLIVLGFAVFINSLFERRERWRNYPGSRDRQPPVGPPPPGSDLQPPRS